MKKKSLAKQTLKVSLHGMDHRMQKMMVSYLELNCKRLAHVVEESESQAEIIDIDLAHSKSLLEERLAQHPSKPIIVLSLNKVSLENVIFVKKPIVVSEVIETLKLVKKNFIKSNKASLRNNSQSDEIVESESSTSLNNGNLTNEMLEIDNPQDHSIIDAKLQKSSNDFLILELAEVETPDNTLITSTPESIQIKKQKKQSKKNAVDLTNKEEAVVVKSKEDEDNVSLLSKKTTPLSTLKNETVKLSSVQSLKKEFVSREIDKITKNINSVGEEIIDRPNSRERRKEVRYEFFPFEVKLNKKSITGMSKNHIALVINVSSKGALIELDKPLKLRGKVTLYLKFDSENVFVIRATIVRNKGKMLYGLNFLDYQHEFLGLLVNSGRSFSYD